MAILINKLSNHFAAEVLGVDLRNLIDDDTFKQIRDAFYEHSVLVFRDQDINDEQQVAFSQRFGSLESSVKNNPYRGGGEFVIVLSNVNKKGEIVPPDSDKMRFLSGNMLWHSDSSFKRIPAKASLLSGREVPPEGGETEYASMRAAYASLPDEKKVLLEGLIAIHDYSYSRGQVAPDLLTQALKDEIPPVPQILIRTIPETGEKTLFIGSHASYIIGWSIEKSRALLKELLEWTTQPRFVYQHKWRRKDLVMWDNRCCLHRGRPWDGRKYRRVMHRTTLAGDGPTV
jgi:alpha-ketoglutarate-dependent 2,4-dichlorophenoxyacetate dioxygenase